jgi:hypothetical protein
MNKSRYHGGDLDRDVIYNFVYTRFQSKVRRNIDKELKQNVKKIDNTTPTIEKTKVDEKDDNKKADNKKADDEKADKCEGHKNLLNFLFEDDPRYCTEGQKFGDATCMKCNSTFMQKDTKPNSSCPIHFCPNFEEECEAVLCHGCYMALNTSTISTHPRWNHNQNV